MRPLKDFLKDRRGATAVTFALMLVPILGTAGLAVDYSRASSDRSRLQNAADSAALAGASVFTGTNAQAAEERARSYLRANLGDQADDVTFGFSANNQRVNVSIAGQTNSLFMQLLDRDRVDIGVSAQALAPLKPTTAEIKINNVYGWYFKRVSIIVVRKGKEVQVGTIAYKAVDHSGGGGRGTGVTSPPITDTTKFDLGDYTKLYLKMEIKNDGCDVGYRNTSTTSMVVCETSTRDADARYTLTLRTDDPATVHHLFVGDTPDRLVQLPAGSKPPLDELLNCDSQWHFHGWEDGGGFAQQDFFYQVRSACKSVDGENVRLTQ